VPDGPWCRRVRVCAISRQEANLSPMASGGGDPLLFAPPHDAGADARRTADGSAPAATIPPLPQDASGLPDPTAAATASGGSGASLGNTSRRAEQSAVIELTTLVRTLAASVRELRADVKTLRDPTGPSPPGAAPRRPPRTRGPPTSVATEATTPSGTPPAGSPRPA